MNYTGKDAERRGPSVIAASLPTPAYTLLHMMSKVVERKTVAVQQELWHDSIFDAATAAVQAAGGPKKVAAQLWPGLDVSSASSRLRGCLSPDHPQKLCLSEFVLLARIAKEAGDHSISEFLARELGYAKPIPIEPEDQAAEILRRVDVAKEELRTCLQQLDKLPRSGR